MCYLIILKLLPPFALSVSLSFQHFLGIKVILNYLYEINENLCVPVIMR